MIDKQLIKRNFSRYARYYDKYSTVQNLCAARLIAGIEADSPGSILDMGCGTGNYTKLLSERFPEARITAVDISGEMIEVAKGRLRAEAVEFIIADGETINFKERFDLISSNASFQWFEDLEKALSRYRKLLDKNGAILFSIFGPLTFYELGESLKELSGEGSAIGSCNFFKKAGLEKILGRLFRDIEVEQKIYKEDYGSLPELLKNIRYTGARGNGLDRKGFWTARMMGDLEKIYKKKSKDITATYQVFFCKGAK